MTHCQLVHYDEAKDTLRYMGTVPGGKEFAAALYGHELATGTGSRFLDRMVNDGLAAHEKVDGEWRYRWLP